jgi:hypothetical protein
LLDLNHLMHLERPVRRRRKILKNKLAINSWMRVLIVVIWKKLKNK